MSGLPTVVNVRVAELRKRGYNSFEEWAAVPGHVYIGRNMCAYVPGTTKSKWANPFPVKKFADEVEPVRACCQAYYDYVVADKALLWQIDELASATELGCWCKPEMCHGDVLTYLLDLKRKTAAGLA